MRKLLFLFFPVFLLSGCGTSLSGTSGYPYNAEWTLVFSDEFNGPELDSASWTAIERGASWNNEDQAYDPSNAFVENGILVLESRRETWTGPTNLPWHPEDPGIVTRYYTSALVNTRGKKNWLYGRFECRAKVCKTPGMLTAIWMLPENGEWPPEIDNLEVLGGSTSTAHFTNHYGTQGNAQSCHGEYTGPNDLAEDFHVYTVEWEPDAIRWYVDGVLRHESKSGVPQTPFYFILCPAIGPDWTGDPTDESVFPQRFEIDWVRVYQKREGA